VLLLVDLDGVVYRGRDPVPGIPRLLADRVAAGDVVLYVTNNSSRHRTEYLSRLTAIGAPVRPEWIFSSARATALELTQGDSPSRTVMVLGEAGLVQELRDVGLRAVPPTGRGLAAHPDTVVVGIDRRLTYARLAAAADAVRAGARFVATNRDPVFPTPNGFTPGAGSIVAAVEAAGRRSPDIVMGKPDPRLLRAAARSVGAAAADAVVIGDGLGTDIAAAIAVGARSVLMLTGVTRREEVDRLPAERRPTAVAADADELAAILLRFAA
jgi:4-nitrophenyl phosphatase